MSDQDYTVNITARHMDLTEAMREHCRERLSRIHMEYPRIMEAKFILDAQPHAGDGHIAELILHCANDITIEASTETKDLYEAIDLTMAKVERQMRKEKTKHLNRNGHS